MTAPDSPIFRFEAGRLWYRSHRSTPREMQVVRALFIAEPWTGATPTSAELVEQIDTALKEMEKV